MSRKSTIDAKDIEILNILQSEGAINNKDLANKIGLSESPTLTRVNNLIGKGFITSFIACVDLQKFGYKFSTVVEYTVPESFTKPFIGIVTESKNLLFLFELYRDAGMGIRHVTFLAMYTHKSQQHFLGKMKEIIAPIPFPVDYRIYEIAKIIKKLPTIKLSLD